MTRSIWLKSFSGAAARAIAIPEELARLGFDVYLDKSRPQSDDCCVVAIAELDANVIAEIEKLSKSSYVLVLSIPALKISAEVRWQLLHAGVADVLDWTDNGKVTEQIAARVRRWAGIQAPSRRSGDVRQHARARRSQPRI